MWKLWFESIVKLKSLHPSWLQIVSLFTYMMPNRVDQLPVTANESWLTSTDTPVPCSNSIDGPDILHCTTRMLGTKTKTDSQRFLCMLKQLFNVWCICSVGLMVCQCTVYWLWDDIMYSADPNVHPTPDLWDFNSLQFVLYPNSHHLRHWTHKNIDITTFLTSHKIFTRLFIQGNSSLAIRKQCSSVDSANSDIFWKMPVEPHGAGLWANIPLQDVRLSCHLHRVSTVWSESCIPVRFFYDLHSQTPLRPFTRMYLIDYIVWVLTSWTLGMGWIRT